MSYLTVPFFHYVFGILPIWPAWLATSLVGLYLILFKERFDPRTTVFWIAILFILPVAGLFVFLYCGSTLGTRRIGERKARLEKDALAAPSEIREECDGSLSPLLDSYGADVCVGGSRATLHWINSDGADVIANTLASARRSIHIEANRLTSGELGRTIADVLCSKASSGVDVRILTSSLWFGRTPNLRRMKRAGVKHSTFRPWPIAALSLRTFGRTFRNIAVVDGKKAFLGSDTFAEFEGIAAYRMETRFMVDWARASHEGFEEVHIAEPVGSDLIQAVPSGPDSGSALVHGYTKLISDAKNTLLIGFPFMIPGDEMYDIIRQVALAGTEVILLLPMKCRHWYQKWNSLAASQPLTEAGVKVFFSRRSMEASVAVADGSVCILGSGVFNSRSPSSDYTMNVAVYSVPFAEAMTRHFSDEVAGAAMLTPQDYRGRSFTDKLKIAISRMLMFLN